MSSRFPASRPQAAEKRQPMLGERAYARTIAFIAGHLGEPLCLADIAAAACISRFHFARLFRARTGSSPMAYVMRLRLERAREMLAREDGCIADTAAALGFYDQSHFTRTFRRIHGVPPRVFRSHSRNGAAAAAHSHIDAHP
jgi:AraC-like DNA-binding protein